MPRNRPFKIHRHLNLNIDAQCRGHACWSWRLFTGRVLCTPRSSPGDLPCPCWALQLAPSRHLCLCDAGVPRCLHSQRHLTKWCNNHSLRWGDLNQASLCRVWLLLTILTAVCAKGKPQVPLQLCSSIGSTTHVYLYCPNIQEPSS